MSCNINDKVLDIIKNTGLEMNQDNIRAVSRVVANALFNNDDMVSKITNKDSGYTVRANIGLAVRSRKKPFEVRCEEICYWRTKKH